jgi:hypothetical protein
MSAFSDLQKKLEKEAQGIMFPFSVKTPTVDTKQEVYNSATDGIMTMQGQKYVGPDSVIQYGSEEEGFARQLKQIEAPMLPQFDADQFPKAGEGIVQTPTPTPPPTTGPVQPVEPEQPTFDPCPPGFIFDRQLQRCVPIEQPSDRNKSIKLDTRTNNQKGRDSLENFGIKLTGGEDSIFADPEKTRAMFGSKQASTGERFGELPKFTVEDFETGYPSFLPGAAIVNLLGQAFVAPSTINQLEKNGFIVKTGNKKNNKDEYTLSENGIRSIVQSEVDDAKPRMERSLRQQGFTQKQIDSGQALAEMRKTDRYDDIPEDKLTEAQKRAKEEAEKREDRRVKEYQKRESKKYTQKQKDDFDKKIKELEGLTALERAEKQRKERAKSGGGGDSDKDGGCVIATHGVSTGGFTLMEKAKAELWCKKTYHGKWYGEIFRKGYRAVGMKHVNNGTAPKVYQEFKNFIAYGRGIKKDWKSAINYYYRTITFFIIGLFMGDK